MCNPLLRRLQQITKEKIIDKFPLTRERTGGKAKLHKNNPTTNSGDNEENEDEEDEAETQKGTAPSRNKSRHMHTTGHVNH